MCVGLRLKKDMMNLGLCPETDTSKLFFSAAAKCCSLVVCSHWRISTMQNTDVTHLGLFSSPCPFLKIKKMPSRGKKRQKRGVVHNDNLSGSD